MIRNLLAGAAVLAFAAPAAALPIGSTLGQSTVVVHVSNQLTAPVTVSSAQAQCISGFTATSVPAGGKQDITMKVTDPNCTQASIGLFMSGGAKWRGSLTISNSLTRNHMTLNGSAGAVTATASATTSEATPGQVWLTAK